LADMEFEIIVLLIYFKIVESVLFKETLHRCDILAKYFGAFEKIIGRGKIQGFRKGADRVLLIDLPGVLVFQRAIMDPQVESRIQGELDQIQAFHLAASHRQVTSIPVVIQHPERSGFDAITVLSIDLGIVAREAEL